MIISHDHRFIFVHVYKTAGTSIMEALEPYAHNPPSWVFWPGIRKLKLHETSSNARWQCFPKHISAPEVQSRVSDKIFRNYFKFSIVRNPWDWHVSIYHYILKWKEHPDHLHVKTLGSFERYVEWMVHQPLSLQGSFALQKDFLYNDFDKCLVDFVGKFENLQKDFNFICKKVGIPEVDLPKTNATSHAAYQTYYNDRTRLMIEKKFEKDIALWNYAFE